MFSVFFEPFYLCCLLCWCVGCSVLWFGCVGFFVVVVFNWFHDYSLYSNSMVVVYDEFYYTKASKLQHPTCHWLWVYGPDSLLIVWHTGKPESPSWVWLYLIQGIWAFQYFSLPVLYLRRVDCTSHRTILIEASLFFCCC